MSLSFAAYQYIQAATYINIPIITILSELSIRNHHTSQRFICDVSTELIQEDHCSNTKINDYLNRHTLNALITYQFQINRSVDEIHSNLVRWTNGSILTGNLAEDYTIGRIWLQLRRYNSHVKLLHTQEAFTETFARDYILDAHRLGFSINQIISHLLSHFPQQANVFTSELIYSVLLMYRCNIKAMTVGRRKWDSAGEKFMQAARNLGICKEDTNCALIMARYDVECDAAKIEQAWNTELVEESSATTPQVTLPILVRAPTNSTTAGNEVEYDATETITETGEDDAKSFARTSTDDSYPIMAPPRNSTTAGNDVPHDAAAAENVLVSPKSELSSLADLPPKNLTRFWPIRVEAEEDKAAKSFAAGTSEDSYPIMAPSLTPNTPKNTTVQREDAGRRYW